MRHRAVEVGARHVDVDLSSHPAGLRLKYS
jgi:hypothetical protein